MSDQEKEGQDGQGTNTSTENQENEESSSGEGQNEQKLVSKEALDKALSDMHKFKKRAQELEAKFKKEEMESLKQKQEWQKIAELKEKEAQELAEEKELIKKSLVSDKKYTAIKEAALKAGVLESALDDLELLNFPEVQVESTSTGRINVIGASEAVQRLKTLRPHWFGKGAPRINGKMPNVDNKGDGIVTLDKLRKLRVEAMKSGDYSAYEKAHKQFTERK